MSDLDEARARRAIESIAGGVAPRDTVPTGFPSVNNALGGGMRRGDLVILGGNTAYNAPADLNWAELQKKAKTVVRLGYYEDDTFAGSTWRSALGLEDRAILSLRRGGWMSRMSPTARASASAANCRILVCAIPASNGWGARTASSQVRRSSHSRRCMRVAWRGDAFIRANSDGPSSTWRRASSRACWAGLSAPVS